MTEVIYKYKGREREYQNEWRKKHRDNHRLEYEKDYRKENREKINSEKRKSAKKCFEQLKNEIFGLFDNKCSNPDCPIPKEKMDKRCLQIDHINGNGRQERKKLATGTMLYYRKVLESIKSGERKYQLLCAYCNWLKRYTIKKESD